MRSIALLHPHDVRWKNYLGRVAHDFYHRPEYLAAASKHEGGEPAAFFAREGDNFILIPLLLRSLPEELNAPHCRDALSPYGYPSPIVHVADDDPDAASRLLSYFVEYCKDNCIISFFSRLHPLLPVPLTTLSKFGDTHFHGETVFMDLRKSETALESELRRVHLTNIRKACRAGFRLEIKGKESLDEFFRIYTMTMEALRASSFYFFSRDYFVQLLRDLEDLIKFFIVYSPDGEPAAASLVGICSGIAQAHLIGNDRRFSKHAPSKLSFLEGARQLKERGCWAFHLGGGVGAQNDSLFHYKSGFSPNRGKFYTWRCIFRQDYYNELVNRRHSFSDGTSSPNGFFPLYRAIVSPERTRAAAE